MIRNLSLLVFLAMMSLVVGACGLIEPTPVTPPPVVVAPPPETPPQTTSKHRLVDENGKEMPMTVELLQAKYLSADRFVFSISVCLDPIPYPDEPSKRWIYSQMVFRLYRSEDGKNVFGELGGNRMDNPYPSATPNCRIYPGYDDSWHVIDPSDPIIKYIIAIGGYGLDAPVLGQPARWDLPPNGTYVLPLN